MQATPDKTLKRYTITDFKKAHIFEGTKSECASFLGIASSTFKAHVNKTDKRCKGFYFINTK